MVAIHKSLVTDRLRAKVKTRRFTNRLQVRQDYAKLNFCSAKDIRRK